MTSWIFGLIAVLVIFGTWRILRAQRAREALLRQRRDRTGRAMLGNFGDRTSDAAARLAVFDQEHLTRTSVEHASTLPVSFNNSGGWLSSDSCLPTASNASNDGGTSAASDKV